MLNNRPLIVFEGPEKCGKSKQLERLSQVLRSKKIKHDKTREPGGTKKGEKIRHKLLNHNQEMSFKEQFDLFSKSRELNVEQRIIPALKKGLIVLSDRFALSSRVYQGYVGGVSKNYIEKKTQKATKGLKPDLQIVIDIPVEEVLRRMDKNKDQFEAREKKFHQEVCAGYRKLAKKQAQQHGNTVLIKGDESIDMVQERITKKVTKLLNSPGK